MVILSVQHACRHSMSHLLLVVLLLYAGVDGASENECESHREVCGTVSGHQGVIMSPGYPHGYPDRVCCSWAFNLRPSEILILRVYDLDVEDDAAGECGGRRPCCRHSWLALPQRSSASAAAAAAFASTSASAGATADAAGGVRRLCGRGRGRLLLKAPPPRAVLKFYTSKVEDPGRGFNLSYSIEHASRACLHWDERPCGGVSGGCFNASQRCDGLRDCPSGADERGCRPPAHAHPPPVEEDEEEAANVSPGEREEDGPAANAEDDFCMAPGALPCRTGGRCYRHTALCDGRPDCADFSDEVNCGYCPDGQALCSPEGGHCFDPLLQRCDGRFDCPCGEDEISCNAACPGLLSCGAAGGCFSASALRAPDGRACPALGPALPYSPGASLASALLTSGIATPAARKYLRFRCENGLCVAPALRCDGQDDCGDASDERFCAKNSVIAAAIVGSLTCGLLLVLGAGCLRRAYAARMHGARGSASAASAAAALGLPPPLAPGTLAPPRRPPPPPPPHHLYAEALLLAQEPPPTYSYAMMEARGRPSPSLQWPQPPPPLPPPPGESRGRRPRRHAPSRRALRQRPPPPPALPISPTVAPALSPCTPAPPPATASAPATPSAHAHAATTVETSLATGRAKRHSAEGDTIASGTSSTSSPSPSQESATSTTSLLGCISATIAAATSSPVPSLLSLPPSLPVDDDAPLLHA